LVSECSTRLGLNIHRGKSKVLKIHTANANPIMLQGGKIVRSGQLPIFG
jgi:hypothetical protein